jgi:hypothetical protein
VSTMSLVNCKCNTTFFTFFKTPMKNWLSHVCGVEPKKPFFALCQLVHHQNFKGLSLPQNLLFAIIEALGKRTFPWQPVSEMRPFAMAPIFTTSRQSPFPSIGPL